MVFYFIQAEELETSLRVVSYWFFLKRSCWFLF